MKKVYLHGHKINPFVLFLMIAILLYESVSNVPAQEQRQALGELRIEGKHIERLVLCRKDGRTEQFNEPNETIKLATGEYRLQDVRLKDGFIYSNRNPAYNWVAVIGGEQAVLKVGAPLKQTVSIERQGPVLELKYNLVGVGGETYAVTRSKHPTFAVFKGEKKVAGGKFEFG
jgi:hypothetical protein